MAGEVKNVGAVFAGVNTSVKGVALQHNGLSTPRGVQLLTRLNMSVLQSVSKPLLFQADLFESVDKQQRVTFDELVSVNRGYAATTQAMQHVFCTLRQDTHKSVGYASFNLAAFINFASLQHVGLGINSPVSALFYGVRASTTSKSVALSADVNVSKAVDVPCRHYPIPEPPPEKPVRVCRVRPPSSALPLTLRRTRTNLPSSALPLRLACWHDEPVNIIPNRSAYIMHTVITANIGGIDVSPLSFEIRTDMNSYCWRGDIDISPHDYERIKAKLDVAVGSEPMMTVTINNHRFTLIAEESSRSRSFANHTHNIAGRSITARLGADYAKANDAMFDQANYATQLINQQLQNTPVVVDAYDVSDWLIPANTYSVSNKTPIAVIAELADAVGGFVQSHDFDSKLSIKKRWKVNAWELASATPDVTIPADVIKSSTDKPRKFSRYNVVTLIGNVEGYSVYRQTQGRDLPAPTQSSALFTSQDVTLPKGEAILSDSGKHNIYGLKMPWSTEIELAELGQIWQVNDLDGSWRGVVTGVSLSVELVDDTPVPFQTVTVDRYLDV